MPNDMSHAPVLRGPRSADLAHIPHLFAPPGIGHTLQFLRDPYGIYARSKARLGPIYKIKLLGEWRVTLGGADALDFILGDTDQLFSSHGGWDMLDPLFPGGLMLRDFEDHKAHRRIMNVAFRKAVMTGYRDKMQTLLPALLADWPTGTAFPVYPAIKRLTLKMGASVFMGLKPHDPRVPALNAAFEAEVAASLGIVRQPLPFTAMRRGTQARALLRDTFRSLIAGRRAASGSDFFSQMCAAVDDDGSSWTEDEVLDHFNFLMMAAHDTTAAALVKIIWALGRYPEWQDRVRAEIQALPDGPLSDTDLATLTDTDLVFREALRLLPPVPFIPRQAVRAFDWQGVAFPAGTWVSALPGPVMMSDTYWTDPASFDPERFTPARAEDRRHRYAWAPFGGGAHKCIGLHFAGLQVKLFLAALLRDRRISVPQDDTTWLRVPIPQPKGGLPIVLHS